MIEPIIITALALYAAGVLQSEGMLLQPLRKWLNGKGIPVFLAKPLYACPPCMASIWGSIVWFFVGVDFFSVDWPLFVFSVCGLTYILIYNFPYDD